MALFDIFKFKSRKRKVDEKLKRPPKGALKRVVKEKKPKEEPEEVKVVPVGKPEGKPEGKSELGSFIFVRPHITEKTTLSSEKNIYTFRVSPRANKVMVRQALKEIYGFIPKKVRILNMPTKPRLNRGRVGTRSGYKKALVYLKEGDKIDIA